MKTHNLVEQATADQLRKVIIDFVDNHASKRSLSALDKCFQRAGLSAPSDRARKSHVELPYGMEMTFDRAKRIANEKYLHQLGAKMVHIIHTMPTKLTIDQIALALPKEDYGTIKDPKTGTLPHSIKTSLSGLLMLAGMVQKTGRAPGRTKSGRYWEPHPYTMGWDEHQRIGHLEEMLSKLPGMVKNAAIKTDAMSAAQQSTTKPVSDFSSII